MRCGDVAFLVFFLVHAVVCLCFSGRCVVLPRRNPPPCCRGPNLVAFYLSPPLRRPRHLGVRHPARRGQQRRRAHSAALSVSCVVAHLSRPSLGIGQAAPPGVPRHRGGPARSGKDMTARGPARRRSLQMSLAVFSIKLLSRRARRGRAPPAWHFS